MPQFEKGKRYCEECLEEQDKEDITKDGYSYCCDERVVGFLEAQQINTKWHAEDIF